MQKREKERIKGGVRVKFAFCSCPVRFLHVAFPWAVILHNRKYKGGEPHCYSESYKSCIDKQVHMVKNIYQTFNVNAFQGGRNVKAYDYIRIDR